LPAAGLVVVQSPHVPVESQGSTAADATPLLSTAIHGISANAIMNDSITVEPLVRMRLSFFLSIFSFTPSAEYPSGFFYLQSYC
jgi:hypothetical protein